MRDLLKKGLDFIRKNPSIIYSLILIASIAGIIFFNTYYFLGKYQESTDALLQSKAILAEDIFHIAVRDEFRDSSKMSEKIKEIKEKDSEIKNIILFEYDDETDKFNEITSATEFQEPEGHDSTLSRIAFNTEEGIAVLGNDKEDRFWKVAKVVKDNQGKRVGLIELNLSLKEHDAFVEDALKKVYLVAIASIIVVLLLTANHARLFQYAVRVAKLEEVDRMKDDFISMASHELKSPLTAIRGYIDLSKDLVKERKYSDGEKELNYLNNMDITAERLSLLVGDILEVSKIEQNRLPIEMQKIDLTQIAQESVREIKINADNKGLRLSLLVSKPANVEADPVRVRQIIVNLLSNSIKYTEKGSVEVSIKPEGKIINLTVADTGMGISAENLENLFSKFYRVKNSKTSKISGTGLGLWLSREIARKMEGDLTVESIEGVGSHFTLKLPKAK